MGNYEFFKQKILQHSVEDEDKGCVRVFTVQDIKAITEFVTKSFYRHYKSYQYSAKEVQETEVVVKEVIVETPLPPAALSDGGWKCTQEFEDLSELSDALGRDVETPLS